MKIILDIPDSVIPTEIRTLMDSGTSTEFEHRQIVEAFLKLALEFIDECHIGVDEYRLVMK